MKKIWMILILCCSTIELYAQYNLILNESFEDTVGGAACYGPIENASFWFNPHGSTPDLYTYFPGYCVGVSSVNNPQGFQMAKTGKAYSGIFTFITQSITRDYIAQRLVDTLVTGKCYYAEMFVSLANRACYATNRFGFYFTDDTSGYSLLTGIIPVTPQINTQGPAFSDTTNWVKVSGTFTAAGGETFVIIGNFNSNGTTTKVLVNTTSSWNAAYYYIDDVSVVPCDSLTSVGSVDRQSVSIYPNPVFHELIVELIGTSESAGNQSLSINDLHGREIYVQKLDFQNNGKVILNLSSLANGVYVLRINSGSECLVRKLIKQ